MFVSKLIFLQDNIHTALSTSPCLWSVSCQQIGEQSSSFEPLEDQPELGRHPKSDAAALQPLVKIGDLPEC